MAGLVRQSYSSIAKLSSQKLSHINVSKHLWGKVLKKVTNAGIESLIHQGIRYGTWNLLANGSGQIFDATYCAPALAGDKTAYVLLCGAGGVMVFRLASDKTMDNPSSVACGIENALIRHISGKQPFKNSFF